MLFKISLLVHELTYKILKLNYISKVYINFNIFFSSQERILYIVYRRKFETPFFCYIIIIILLSSYAVKGKTEEN